MRHLTRWQNFSQAEALPVLRELAEDQKWDVRDGARKVLGRFEQAKDPPLLSEPAENLPLLRQRALSPDDKVAAEAVRGLASRYTREEVNDLR
jgi:HEAT repeat protein